MKFIWRYLKDHKKILTIALLLAAINQSFSLIDPIIFRFIIDNYANKFNELSQNEFISGVLRLLLLSVGVVLVSRIAKTFQSYYVNALAQRFGASLYSHSISHSFNLPYAVFEDHRSGELLQKLEKARTDNQTLVNTFISIVYLPLIGIIFVLTYALVIHWAIGLLYFLMIPALASTAYFISRKIKKIQANIVREQASMAGSTTETLRNVELVKSLGLKDQEIKRLNDVNEQILELELEKVRMIRKLDFIQGTIINALRTSLLFVMMFLIFKQTITLGEFFSLWVYSFFIFTPLAQFGEFITQYRETQASNEQLDEILNIKPEKKPSKIKKIGKLRNIKFNDISFKYQSGKDASLKKINLDIKAGETVAFVGPSGSGKSTMVKLLVGLYTPTSGKLFFNDIEQSDLDFEELRRKIGFVAQEVQLFAGSIRENLLFVNPKATDKECLKALEDAAAMSILDRGGKGLDSIIGESGIKLSGGERQRLAIARALLRDPEILIFDEATSSLDSITEAAITETIKHIEEKNPELMRVLVAHRLSTIMHADKIFVLKDGEVVESGDHSQLLKDKALYSLLWKQQANGIEKK